MDGREREGRGSSPKRRTRRKELQTEGRRAAALATPATVLCARTSGAKARRKENGGGGVLGCAGALHFKPIRGGEGEIVGAGCGFVGSAEREREAGRRFGGEEGPDGWAPPISRQRERERRGKGGSRLGQA